MNDIDWFAIEHKYRMKLSAFNAFHWHRCKNQLISMGMPLDAVAFVMSVPETCKNSLDVLRVSLSHYPIIK